MLAAAALSLAAAACSHPQLHPVPRHYTQPYAVPPSLQGHQDSGAAEGKRAARASLGVSPSADILPRITYDVPRLTTTEHVSVMGRLEREIQNHPVKVAKSAFGPYFGFFALVLVYGWPFGVFHGTTRLAVGIPWLIITIAITLVIIVGNRKKTPLAPAKIPQKATTAKRDAASSSNVLSPRALSPNASSRLVSDELRKLAELRDSGILTEAEFVKQKRRLLD